jgi:hypothetical protein
MLKLVTWSMTAIFEWRLQYLSRSVCNGYKTTIACAHTSAKQWLVCLADCMAVNIAHGTGRS